MDISVYDITPYTESEFQARHRFSPNSLQILADLLQEQLQSTVSRVVHAVTNTICCHGADFLRWPTDSERAVTMSGCYQIAQFPCVIGAVDGTHISIQVPPQDE